MSSLNTLTLHAVFDLLAAFSLAVGLFFMLVGPIGIHRFPDAFNRIHAASKCQTLGLSALLVAVCFHVSDAVTVGKAIITIVFTFVATPVGSHMIAKAAHHAKERIWEGTLSDELAEDKADASMAISDDDQGWDSVAGSPAPRLSNPDQDRRGAA